MSNTDYLAKAKDCLAEGDYHQTKRDEFYAEAGHQIQRWLDEDTSRTQAEAARSLGVHAMAVTRALQASRTGKVDWASGSNKRDEVARKVLSDPAQRREVIDSLSDDERTELVREVARSAPSQTPSTDRDEQREVIRGIEDAPEHDLSALAARLVATTSRIEVELSEGGEFKRMGAAELQRLDRDLDRVKDTADRLKEQIGAQSRVRRIA